jgi:hypothetical protein
MNLFTVLIGLFVFVAGPVWLSLFLRRRHPNSKKIGLPLAVLFPIFSQFYVPGAAGAIIVVFSCGVILYKLSVTGILLWVCTGFVSAALMYRRLNRAGAAG